VADGELLNHVKKFLAESGFPLEIKVAIAFRNKRILVQQAVFYVDVNTGALREMDVLAYARKTMPEHMDRVAVELRMVIECKRSGQPWLLFIGDERFSRSRQHFESLDILEYHEAKLVEARSADDMPVISHVGDVAYRLSSTGQKDNAFPAVQQVNSAVLGLKRELPAREDYRGEPKVVVFVPVIVTDAPLFSCRVNSDGDIVPEAVDKGLLLTRLRSGDRLQSIWVVNDKGLEDFSRLARSTADFVTAHVHH